MLVCVGGVYRTLIKFEANQPEAFVKKSLSTLNDEKMHSLFESNSKYENEKDFMKNLHNFFKSDKYQIKKEDTLLYGVYFNDNLLLKMQLKSKNHVNKLGIISYDELEVEKIEGHDNKELFHYSVSAPSDYEVIVNGKKLEDGETSKIAGFVDGYDYVDLPSMKLYDLDHLTKEPEVVIKHNGQNVDYEYKTDIEVDNGYQHFNTLEEAGVDFDIKSFAENWSLYLTNDLTGPAHGLNIISTHLIEGTSMYTKARQWGTSIDITFTSRHTLKKPIFTNESFKNVIKYSDNAVSIDVYLEKNMVVSGQDKVDKFNSTIYLIKYNNAWKVINIKGVTNN
jgi:hypothetical protein